MSRCLLLLREKGCFLLYKAASSVFWYTIVWTSVLAGRVSDTPDPAVRCVGEGAFWEDPFRPRKSELAVSGQLCNAPPVRTSFGLGFISALYWRQTFTNKGKGETVLKETNFLWQEYYLLFWPIRVSLGLGFLCWLFDFHIIIERHCLLCTKLIPTALHWNKPVTVFLRKVLRGIFTLSKCICTPEMSQFPVSF